MRVAGVPLSAITTPAAGRLGIVEQHGGAEEIEWGSGGARLLRTDFGVVILLLGQARRRLVARVFGVPVDKTGLVTVIALATLAEAGHDRMTHVIAVPGVPSLGGTMFVGTAAKDVAHLIAGDWSRETPLFGSLVAVVALGTLARPALRVSFRDLKASSHRVRVSFDRRYGHLVRRNRPNSS